MDPKEREQRLSQAREHAAARRLAEAEERLLPVLDAAPDDVLALDLLGFIRFFQGRYAEGERACRDAIALAPERAYGHKGLGLHLARQGQLEAGLASLKTAIRLSPTWLDPRWDLMVVLMEHQRWAEAESALTDAEAALPAQREALARMRKTLESRRPR